MEKKIAWAEFVLVTCTPIYLKRWQNEEEPNVGLGAQWESLLTRQHLYQAAGNNNKFVPIVFNTLHIDSIPIPLAGVTRIDLSEAEGFDHLRCRLLNIAPAEKPPVRTSLAPFALAEGFFSKQIQKTVRYSQDGKFHHQPFGLAKDSESLFPNLFSVSYPQTMQVAKVKFKKRAKVEEIFSLIWKQLGNNTAPPVDYLIEDSALYTFRPFTDVFWKAMINAKAIHLLPPKPTSDWADSNVMGDKNKFIMLLNRCLDQLCFLNDTAHKMAYSKKMKCHLFIAEKGKDKGVIKVKAIKKEGTRTVYKAIPNKLSPEKNEIQHWQHEAFRHYFVRFGGEWFLNVIPFWAFTSDGNSSPSRFQKKSSSNMRKPERNRAVFGHVAFWASILCREPDLFRKEEFFRINRPVGLTVSPSICDSDWLSIAKTDEKSTLTDDLKSDVLL